jgi:hypothetical protein
MFNKELLKSFSQRLGKDKDVYFCIQHCAGYSSLGKDANNEVKSIPIGK